MALCRAGAMSNFLKPVPFTAAPTNHTRRRLSWRPSIPGFTPGVPYYGNSTIRLATSEESSSFTSQYVKDGPDGSVITEDTQTDANNNAYEAVLSETPKQEEKYDDSVTTEDTLLDAKSNAYEAVQTETPKEKEKYDGSVTTEDTVSDAKSNAYEAVQTEIPKREEKYDVASFNEASNEDSSLDFQAQLSKFFYQLGIEYDPENSSSILLFGGGAILALWLTSAVVGAIDSIPLFPKLMELVGLGYTLWFTIRYLLFENTREELAAKIGDIKQQVLGSEDD